MTVGRTERLALFALLAAGFVLRLVEAIGRPLQVDEALMVAEARLPLRMGLANIAADVHPPLILVVLRPLEIIHAPDIVLRLVMIAFGLCSIALLYAIVRRWADAPTALLAAACAAVMPTIAHYDTWIRMYAPLSTVELLGWYALTEIVLARDAAAGRRRMLWALWIASSAAGAYLHYLAWISLAAQGVWIALRHRRDLLAFAGATIATFVLWLPQLGTFITQISRGGGRSWAFALEHPLSAIAQIPGQALLHPETDFGLDAVRVFAIVWLACALATVLAYRRGGALPWLGLSAVMTVGASLAAGLSLYGDRYFLPLAYAVCAWTAIGLERLWSLGKPYRYAVVGSLAVLAACTALFAADPFYYTADWPAVADYLRTHAARGDPFIAEQSSPFLALTHYADLSGHKLVGVDSSADAEAAVAYAGAHRHVWLILFESTAVDPDEALVKGLTRGLRPLGYVRFPRAATAETVLVAEFAGSPASAAH